MAMIDELRSQYYAIQDNITDAIVRLDRIEAAINKPAEVRTSITAISPSQLWALLDHMKRDEKINAIKYWREITGDGLKEAKDAVEYWSPKIKD